ncbi:hypothetical protein BGZ95_000755 [Linnemannia exigua]|uniref:Uncharacterized protein n=1 Tax=Linnemannia exigua TaxID=604196 RepID=A0AAD4D7T1_9FUNG|nr:hypothetical protein BGZ95_000755 [Linnemannia exigua]
MVTILTVAMKDANRVHINTMEFPLSEGSKLLGLHQSVLNGHSYMVIALSTLVLVWRISASPEVDYDLLWAEGTNADAEWSFCDGEYTLVLNEGADVETEWRLCQHQKLHRRNIAGDISTRNILDKNVPNPDAFLDGIVRLVEIFKDADEMSKRAIIRYVERHINQCLDPENDSTAILTRLCASWSAGFHEHMLAFVRALFGSSSFRWVPKPTMSQEPNPILILIGRLEDNLYVLDIVEVMLNYCIRMAKVDSDLLFLGPITQSLRIALDFQGVDSGVFTRTLRSFAYFPAREYHFAVDHHAVTDPPFDSNKKKMLHDCKDPILELSAKPAAVPISKRLTPKLYVAYFDMIWSYEEIPISKRKFWAVIQEFLLLVTVTSKKRCICHPFDLEDLDNPAIVALVRYKWMKVGFHFWLLQTLFYGYTAVFFIVRIFYDIYGNGDPVFSQTVSIINVALSWIFALGALRDLFVLTAILKMKPHSEKKPDKIYYTATPQQVRKYKLETQRLYEEAAAAALPLESDLPEDAKARYPPPELAIAPEQEESTQKQEQDQHSEDQQLQHSPPLPRQQQQLENWVGRLKEDMKAEFKEELIEQLDVQKKRMDEQNEQLRAHLKEQNEELQSQIRELMAVLRAGERSG